jgi:hypothetical protein
MKLLEAQVLLTKGQKLIHTEQDTRDPLQKTSNTCMHMQLTNATTTSFTSADKLNTMKRKTMKEMNGQALLVQRELKGETT